MKVITKFATKPFLYSRDGADSLNIGDNKLVNLKIKTLWSAYVCICKINIIL